MMNSNPDADNMDGSSVDTEQCSKHQRTSQTAEMVQKLNREETHAGEWGTRQRFFSAASAPAGTHEN